MAVGYRSFSASPGSVTAADNGKLLRFTGSAAETVNLDAVASLGTGTYFEISHEGTGQGAAGKMTITPNGSEKVDTLATLVMYPGEKRGFLVTGTPGAEIETELLHGGFIEVQVGDGASGWALTVGSKWTDVYVELWGPGGAGGAGRRGAAGTQRMGGSGGGGGACVYERFRATDLPAAGSNITVTTPVGGIGGAAQTVDSTNGASGAAASASTFGTLMTAYPGGPGVGGDNSAINSGGSGGGWMGAGLTGVANGSAAGGQPVGSTVPGYFGGANTVQSNSGNGIPGVFGGASGAGGFLAFSGNPGGSAVKSGSGGSAGGGLSSGDAGAAGGVGGSRTGVSGSGGTGGAAGTSGVAGGSGPDQSQTPTAAGRDWGAAAAGRVSASRRQARAARAARAASPRAAGAAALRSMVRTRARAATAVQASPGFGSTDMTKFAYVRGGVVLNIVAGDAKSDFSDIAEFLVEIVDPGVGPGWVQWSDGTLNAKPFRTLDEAKAEARARIAAQRYAVENGGTVIGGLVVDTDDRAKILIDGAASQAQSGAQSSFTFKAAGGWVTIDGATMIALKEGVAAFIQQCFAREKALDDAIEAAATVAAADAVAW
jgi:hypothetical protein